MVNTVHYTKFRQNRIKIAKNLGKAVPRFWGPNMALFVSKIWHILSPISKLGTFILLFTKMCPPNQIWSNSGNKQGFVPKGSQKTILGAKHGTFCPQKMAYFVPNFKTRHIYIIKCQRVPTKTNLVQFGL